jgi:predicted nucleic acid-binding protein
MTLNIGAHIAIELLRVSKFVKSMKKLIEKLQRKKNVNATFVTEPLITSTVEKSTKKEETQTQSCV